MASDAVQSHNLPAKRGNAVPKPELGTKRNCPSCAARFYDLNKSPVECPKCGEVFEPEVLLKPRRQRAKAPVETAPKAPANDQDEDEEDQEEQVKASDDDDEDEEVEEVKEVDLEAGTLEIEDEANETDEPAAKKKGTTESVDEDLTEVDEDAEDILDDDNEDDVLLEGLDDDDAAIDLDADKDEETPK